MTSRGKASGLVGSRRHRGRAEPSASSPLRLGRAVGLVAIGIGDFSYASLRQLVTLFPRPWPAELQHGVGERGNSPVVLLPGIYENCRFLLPLARRIHRLGHPVHAVLELGHNVCTVAEGAEIVADHLRAHGLSGVTIVAHSKGGLIGKTLMLGQEGHRITRMIAIATPFTGPGWARLAPTRRLRAFSPDDPYAMWLGRSTQADARIVSIRPRQDPLLPGDGAIPGAVNVRLRVSGHFLVLRSGELADALRQSLGG